MQNRGIKILVALGLLVSSTRCASTFVGYVLTRPRRQSIEVPKDLAVIPVTFTSVDGVQLVGSWIKGRPLLPTVLLMHGVYASRKVLWKRARYFSQLGYAVLAFDFRAHGESSGDRITFGLKESDDARAAVKFLRERSPGQKIAAIGISLGGAAALIGSPLPVDALILESVYPDLQHAIQNRVHIYAPAWTEHFFREYLTKVFKQTLRCDVSELRPVKMLEKAAYPILVMSGSEDRHTTLEDTRVLYAAAHEPKELVIFEGARHVDLYDFAPKKYEEIVHGFLVHAFEVKAAPKEQHP